MEFFRHCPGCGRRFHIKLVDKKMVHLDRETLPTRQVVPYGGSGPRFYGPAYLNVQEGSPIVVDVEEFQYLYKCQHCGHEWSEKRVEDHRET